MSRCSIIGYRISNVVVICNAAVLACNGMINQ